MSSLKIIWQCNEEQFLLFKGVKNARHKFVKRVAISQKKIQARRHICTLYIYDRKGHKRRDIILLILQCGKDGWREIQNIDRRSKWNSKRQFRNVKQQKYELALLSKKMKWDLREKKWLPEYCEGLCNILFLLCLSLFKSFSFENC